ncbi:MAG: glycosyltransferase family 2 protein [Nocardioides sp.]
MTVAALLVCHDGARWLPAVLEGLRTQTRAPERVVAVDTGSRDGSVELLLAALGESSVSSARVGTSYPEAVDLGLAEVGDADWVWLLHDDSNPAPTALAELLRAADENPRAEVLGPKLREWPSLKRLLEIGVTISGTGRRETGLERGEYDQGQHDEVRRVLAVNTAGMLVRRRLLVELDGFDPNLPIFGNDLDFGWRAAAAGHTTIAVPQAVVFHAEAAHRGVRRTAVTGHHTHFQQRRAALYTLLANTSGRSLLVQTMRLGLGSLVRALGFLLVRAVGEALDELAALASVYVRPGVVRAARRARRAHQVTDPREVRALLAPRWLPYRHGLDFVGDLVAAATRQAQDVAERRRAAKLEEEGPVAAARPHAEDDEEELIEDTGLVARFLTNPVAVAAAVFLVAALVGARDALGHVSGGGLSPAPADTADWWRLHLQSWHAVGQGSGLPAPPYVAVLALLASLLPGGPATVVSALLLLAVPIAWWGAWRFLRVVGHLLRARGSGRWLLLWGSTTYALVPATSGAWGEVGSAPCWWRRSCPGWPMPRSGWPTPSRTGAGGRAGGRGCCSR